MFKVVGKRKAFVAGQSPSEARCSSYLPKSRKHNGEHQAHYNGSGGGLRLRCRVEHLDDWIIRVRVKDRSKVSNAVK